MLFHTRQIGGHPGFAMPVARVVVVDDEVLIAEYIAGELEEGGYEVAAVCRTREDALAAVARHDPDLVVLDVSLGRGGNGIEVGREIRAGHSAGLVFCSGTRPEDVEREFPGCGILMKPFTPEDLLKVVAETLARGRGTASGG